MNAIIKSSTYTVIIISTIQLLTIVSYSYAWSDPLANFLQPPWSLLRKHKKRLHGSRNIPFVALQRRGGGSEGVYDTVDLEHNSKIEDNTLSIHSRRKFNINVQWNRKGDDDGDDVDEISNTAGPYQVIIIMDGFCHYHGQYIADRAMTSKGNGVVIINVCSNYLAEILIANNQADASDIPRIPNSPIEAEQWKEQLYETIQSMVPKNKINEFTNIAVRRDMIIRAVYCESDSGLADAEMLRQLLQVECHDEPTIFEGRRNKHLMHQTVSNSIVNGLINPVVSIPKQKLCSSQDEAIQFAQTELSFGSGTKVVVKPIRGVASESVYLCSDIEQVKQSYDAITSTGIFGSLNQTNHQSVLVQEYINGIEYAIDVVSKNGTHKIAAIWKYDKRPNNSAKYDKRPNNTANASFCYYQTKLVDSSTDPEHVQALCQAVIPTLDVLGVRWGISHSEFIMRSTDNIPVLIEVNCRQHNMDFCPIVMACIGYNALDMTLDALLLSSTDEDNVDEVDYETRYPDEPILRAHGCMVHLVNYNKGILKNVHHIQDIMDLESVLDMEIYESFQILGQGIEPTCDIRTDAGWVQLINPDEHRLQQDYATIVNFMPTMFEVL
jgi:ATP-grasp domain